MLQKLIYSIPQFRGKAKVLRFLDRVFGPSKMIGRFGIVLQGYYSSMQGCAFLRKASENESLEKLINTLPSNGIFIDIGANCGFYSAVAAKKIGLHGIVISVEPSFREYRRLLWAIKYNLHKCKWIPMNLALGNYTGIEKLNVSSSHTGVNYIVNNEDELGQFCYVNNGDILIENLIPNNRIINLVKIDVEGYEMFVLQGFAFFLKTNLFKRYK